MGWFGAKAEVHYQPLGVVGVISPWNFPVNLTFTPLAGMLAAGNRAMIKPSEFTPATSELMARMFKKVFDETEIAVCLGGPQVGEAFSRLPFDHLLFTGATSIAYHVMRAAAENLVPVTLELGGKSPVIIGQGANIEQSATRVMIGKTMNAGQICLAPDYVLVPEGQRDEFVSKATAAVTRMYPTLKDNPDYTSVINQRHFDRLRGYIDEAKSKGAKVVEINPGARRLAPAAAPQDRADDHPRSDRRHEGDAGRDLRPDPAGQDLQERRRGDRLRQRARRGRSASITSATTRARRSGC